jgi:hypothetical protein
MEKVAEVPRQGDNTTLKNNSGINTRNRQTAREFDLMNLASFIDVALLNFNPERHYTPPLAPLKQRAIRLARKETGIS